MRAYIANTDIGWYRFLRDQPDLDEVNFWFPSPGNLLTAGSPTDPIPLIFKLKKEGGYAVCGFGFLVQAHRMPAWFAWDTFGIKNGTPSATSFYERIGSYRKAPPGPGRSRLEIGSLVVVEPVFFPEALLVPGPKDWNVHIQRGRYYDTSAGEGARVWQACLDRAAGLRSEAVLTVGDQLDLPAWGTPSLTRPRLGQGAFRVAVTKAYGGACAVTQEHSLPVLDAAHIRPFSEVQRHEVRNGVALRADLHRLFDRGYVTFDEGARFVVSPRLREDYENGALYYRMQDEGRRLRMPAEVAARPDPDALAWHREAVFLG